MTPKEKELADNAYLLRAWKKYRAEELSEALAGVHRDVMTRLMAYLEKLHSARELVEFIESINWGAIGTRTRATALHETSQAICRLRESQNLPPFDDPLWDAPLNAFLRIRERINQFPAPLQERPTRRGPYPGASHE
jgi:hypothetical protein